MRKKPKKNQTLEKNPIQPGNYGRLKSTCIYPPSSPIPSANVLSSRLTLAAKVSARLRILDISKKEDPIEERRRAGGYI